MTKVPFCFPPILEIIEGSAPLTQKEMRLASSGQGIQPLAWQESGKSIAVACSRMFLFGRNFFKFPAMLGSVIPSSRFLVNDVLSQVDWSTARVIVEFGPGVGTMTREILRRMRSDATLVAVELNPEFVEFLKAEIPDTRLQLVNTSAGKVRAVLQQLRLPGADCIISGIPYTNMPEPIRREIIEESKRALTPQGAMLIYQFTRTVLPYLESSFPSVRQAFQPLNIFPARIFHCTQ